MKGKRASSPSDKPFVKLFNDLCYRFSPWTVWQDFVIMSAAALSNPFDRENAEKREAAYMKAISKYNEKERGIFPQLLAETVTALERNPAQDYLGKIFMDLDLGNNWTGQFFTPYHVCELMAEISIGDIEPQIKEKGYVSVNDPACGAGATLIAGVNVIARKFDGNWQQHVLVTGQDIDYTVGLMCYIQLSLLGAAGFIKIGNTLTDPMRPGDDLSNYWFTPMYFIGGWPARL